MSLETSSAVGRVTQPCERPRKFGKTVLYSSISAIDSTSSSAVIRPSSRPAAALMALKVEPAGYLPPIARFRSTLSGSEMTSWIRSWEPLTKSEGSKSGYEAKARTSPVLGSSATPAPPVERPFRETCSARASWSACWVPASMVSCTSRPGRGAREETSSRPVGSPAASTSRV